MLFIRQFPLQFVGFLLFAGVFAFVGVCMRSNAYTHIHTGTRGQLLTGGLLLWGAAAGCLVLALVLLFGRDRKPKPGQ